MSLGQRRTSTGRTGRTGRTHTGRTRTGRTAHRKVVSETSQQTAIVLAAAEAIAVSALERRESRGAHVRADFPDHDTEKPVQNVLVEMSNGACKTRCVEAGE